MEAALEPPRADLSGPQRPSAVKSAFSNWPTTLLRTSGESNDMVTGTKVIERSMPGAGHPQIAVALRAGSGRRQRARRPRLRAGHARTRGGVRGPRAGRRRTPGSHPGVSRRGHPAGHRFVLQASGRDLCQSNFVGAQSPRPVNRWYRCYAHFTSSKSVCLKSFPFCSSGSLTDRAAA